MKRTYDPLRNALLAFAITRSMASRSSRSNLRPCTRPSTSRSRRGLGRVTTRSGCGSKFKSQGYAVLVFGHLPRCHVGTKLFEPQPSRHFFHIRPCLPISSFRVACPATHHRAKRCTSQLQIRSGFTIGCQGLWTSPLGATTSTTVRFEPSIQLPASKLQSSLASAISILTTQLSEFGRHHRNCSRRPETITSPAIPKFADL